ncbi:hypothetical protein B0H63DRAFT_36339 [Podospora didyma]|uniref:Uncharacterized protein n=1 Tax=Podospora didyma TaxID=330526 RepID=A0AAE0U7Q2_9PEZI|nr:hypothetical protein B0H63DRAFT_36339 [Podospora didyma]
MAVPCAPLPGVNVGWLQPDVRLLLLITFIALAMRLAAGLFAWLVYSFGELWRCSSCQTKKCDSHSRCGGSLSCLAPAANTEKTRTALPSFPAAWQFSPVAISGPGIANNKDGFPLKLTDSLS